VKASAAEAERAGEAGASGDLARAARALLRSAGIAGPPRLVPLPGGSNNRVYRVEVGGQRLLLKAYFRAGAGGRDRLGAEVAFSRFALAQGLACLPRPVAWDGAQGLALFEFVEGEAFRPGQVGGAEIRAALDFLRALDAGRGSPEARALPLAAEACFTVADHLGCVAERIERLSKLEVREALDAEAAELAASRLAPAWRRLSEELAGGGPAPAGEGERPLAPADRCISPSDFGFHNALRTPGGGICFLDFEYAGWDDPAKLVADFATQPAVPVPLRFFERFAAAVAGLGPDPESGARRIRALFPLFRLKWCCILLNEFLPGARDRRAFARSPEAVREGRALQLERARRLSRELRPGALFGADRP
jgi:hypothetical protein